MTWWMWMVLGLVLAAIELATPGGFFVIFFGVAALVVGVLDLAGVAQPDWVQWLLFPVLAVIALRLFRKPLLARMQHNGSGAVDSLTREPATATTDMAPQQHGHAELRGTTWNARNVGDALIASGQRCRVVAVEGLMLDIIGE
jgi:membrane protein implicated in regulation of membrane protease activity